jgi:signal transduction histidine kinase
LFFGTPLQAATLGKTEMPAPHQFLSSRLDGEDFESRRVEVEGTVKEVRKVFRGVEAELLFGAEHIYLKAPEDDYEALKKFAHERVRVRGIYQSAQELDGQTIPTIILSDLSDAREIKAAEMPPTNSGSNHPMLTTALQVKELSREEAQRGYPVKIRGVITGRVEKAFVIQDWTWSIFCYADQLAEQELPQIGEVWEVDGISDVQFAPDIVARKATYLGPGILPEPIRPTKDELINGSLDTQYITVQGIVTAFDTNGIRLLTREGELQFPPLDDVPSRQLKDALIRISGVYIPNRDTNLMLLPSLSPIRLFNASVSLDAPPPHDLFAVPLKRISDLLQFDARADALRRVKIAGQILLERQGQYFLNDGVNGARFELRDPVSLNSGDWVEVVGFPDLGGPSPMLREATARVIRRAPLAPARTLAEAGAINDKLDATLVTLDSRLLDVSKIHAEETLELKIGPRNYLARLAGTNSGLLEVAPGSVLRLQGVYAAQLNKMNAGNEHSFELLLASPADVRILARPSWWTARHALAVVAGMLLLILGAMIWIALLHRQVEERTHQLASEIKGREQAESQRALETERTRIAQDLHDELGAALTEIRFLGAVKSQGSSASEDMRSHLKEISDKSHQMVSSLDEIVWAINPANDSLPNLANYLCHVAEEFLRRTEIRCRLDVDEAFSTWFLTSEIRHSLYLTVREALNNAAKHSGASEVWLRIHCQEKMLRILVEDNGRGFAAGAVMPAGNGLKGMRSRIEKIGGHFECESQPGNGTRCHIHLQLS